MYTNDTITCEYCESNTATIRDDTRLWTCDDCCTPLESDAEYFAHWDAERAFRDSVSALHDGW